MEGISVKALKNVLVEGSHRFFCKGLMGYPGAVSVSHSLEHIPRNYFNKQINVPCKIPFLKYLLVGESHTLPNFFKLFFDM